MPDRPLSPEYLAYIKSPAWRARREEALARAGGRCQYEVEDPAGLNHIPRCTRTRHLEVHHLTYARLGNELPEDLEVLCWFHHMTEHLMQVGCPWCGGPLLGWYDEAERWLQAELASLSVDIDAGQINWKTLPVKAQLVEALSSLRASCEACKHLEGRL